MSKHPEIFEKHRPRLIKLAYGMLGRISKAKDIVQEAYLRWSDVDRENVRSPGSYLSAIVSRLCLDELKSSRQKREEYIGPNLPEPVAVSDKDNPEEMTELADSLSMAMLILLQRLTPVQRAVFLMREAFDFSYAEIAEAVHKSESHCRKIAQRARDQIEKQKPRFEPSEDKQQELLQTFMSAVHDGRVEKLVELLAEDATLYSDGGGKVTAARKPIQGASNIARFMVGISEKAPADIQIRFETINSKPGFMVFFGDRLQSVWSFRFEKNDISEIYAILNPDKLNPAESLS